MKKRAKLSVPLSSIEIELLHTLQIAVLRNPPVELTSLGIRDGAVWRQYGDTTGFDFFEPVLMDDRPLNSGQEKVWVFEQNGREIAVDGTLTTDRITPLVTPPQNQRPRPQQARRELHETPILTALPPPAEEHPRDFAMRKAEEYELLRRNSEVGNALGPGAASAVGPYDPYWDATRREVFNPFAPDPYNPFASDGYDPFSR
jgi:hypothetical protein